MNRLPIAMACPASVSAVVAALTLSVALTAAAGEPDELISRGVELRKAHRDLEALPLFRKAVEQQPTPRAFAQLGTCEQAVGLWIDAETHLKEALRRKEDAWVSKHETALREALTRVQANLGSIELWGTPSGAKVTVDGQVAGALPTSAPIRAVEGRRSVSIDAPGFVSEKRMVNVEPGSLVREHIALVAIAGTPALLAVPAVPAPEVASRSTALLAVPPPPEGAAQAGDPATAAEEGTPFYRRWWFWTLVGTAAAAGGVTAYLLLRKDSCHPTMGGTCVTF